MNNTNYKQTEIGEIPVDLEVKTWGAISTLVYGANGQIGYYDKCLSKKCWSHCRKKR